MPQIFHPSANTLSRLTLFGMAVGPLGLLVVTYLLIRSPCQTGVRVIREQPVPFYAVNPGCNAFLICFAIKICFFVARKTLGGPGGTSCFFRG